MTRLEVDPIHLFGRLRHPDYIHIDWFSPENLARDRALDNIQRFSSINEMTHRPTVGAHSIKVAFFGFYLSQACLETGIELDQPRLVYMGQHHDDSEIITDDIPTPAKISASRAERRRMAREEKAAVRRLEPSTPKPAWTTSIEELFLEYRGQKTLESRIVNYFDKWDGLHEAVNEVVCGDNKDAFKGVIKDYEPILTTLNRKNKDWQQAISRLLGEDIFQVPDPAKLVAKKVGDVDFSNAFTLATSIAGEYTPSYKWWLMMNTSIFRTFFFRYALPGWEESLPSAIREDIELASIKQDVQIVRDLYPEFNPQFDLATFSRNGLIIPRGHDYEIGSSFGDSLLLAHNELMIFTEQRGEEIRTKTDKTKAKGKYYGPKTREYA